MSLVHLIVLSLALGVAAWLFFMWTVRSGQYEDPEGAKYRMLEDDEGEQAAGRAGPAVHEGGGPRDASPGAPPRDPPGAPRA